MVIAPVGGTNATGLFSAKRVAASILLHVGVLNAELLSAAVVWLI